MQQHSQEGHQALLCVFGQEGGQALLWNAGHQPASPWRHQNPTHHACNPTHLPPPCMPRHVHVIPIMMAI